MHRSQYAHEIGDTLWLMILQGLNYLAPLLVWPYLMTVLGAEQFGCISFAIAANQYLMIIVDFGFNFSSTKGIALAKGNQESINRLFSETLVAKLLLLAGAFVLLLVIVAIPKFRIYTQTSLILFSMVVCSALTCVWLFQGLGKIRIVSIINCVSKIAILPLTFVLVRTSNDTLVAAYILGGVYVVSAILSLLLVRLQRLARLVAITWSGIKAILKDSFPIFVSNAASSIYAMLFVVILGYFALPDEVGKYAAAEKLMRMACYAVWLPVSQAFFPKICQTAGHNRAETRRTLRRLFVIMTAAMLFIGGILFFFARPLSEWLGRDYVGFEPIAKILSIVPLFVAVGGVAGQLGLLTMGNERDKKHFQNIYLSAAGLSVVLTFALVPHFQAIGAGIALLLTECFVCVGMLVGLKKMLR
ncbi:MAG: flippase [Paludibacteraceae bacterium]|nr:flippase [Paludibacteraceae bacterium]